MMSVCESCSTIASLTDTPILLAGSVPGCGRCRQEDYSLDEYPPSHPDITEFVYIHGRDGYVRDKIAEMTGVRSEDSNLFTLEELQVSHPSQRTSSQYALSELATMTSNQRESLDPIGFIDGSVGSPVAPVVVERVAGSEARREQWLAFALGTLATSLVLALFALWIVAAEGGVAISSPQPMIIASAAAPAGATQPVPSLDRTLASTAEQTSKARLEQRTPVLRLEPIVIGAEARSSRQPVRGAAVRTSSAGQGVEAPVTIDESTNSEIRDAQEAPTATMTIDRDVASEESSDVAVLDAAVRALLLGSEDREPTPRAENSADLPATLDRAQLVQGLRDVTRLARNCSDTLDRAPVSFTIEGATGQVRSARIRGPLAGTAEGLCVERALQGAQFSRFTEPLQTVSSYTLIIR